MSDETGYILKKYVVPPKPKLLFIHGLCMNSLCWENWLQFYRAEGYICYAPVWPFHGGDPAARREKQKSLCVLSLNDIIEMYEFMIEYDIKEPPVIISHGIGSLICRILACKGLVSKCIMLGSCKPERNMLIRRLFSIVLNQKKRAIGNTFNYFPAFNVFKKYYANTLSEWDALMIYEQYIFPENYKTIKILRKGYKNINHQIDAPCLFIGGDRDKLAAPKKIKRDFVLYGNLHSMSSFRIINNVSHMSFFLNQTVKELSWIIDEWLLESGDFAPFMMHALN